jgi:hypothetical protein
MRRVILESPYAGDVERNRKYATDCILDCLQRGDAPFASHMLYTEALDDNVPRMRALGIKAGFAWREAAQATVVYTDLGISAGMQQGIDHANSITDHIVEYRSLATTGNVNDENHQ